MDDYCKKNCLSSYVFLDEGSTSGATQAFIQGSKSNGSESSNSIMTVSSTNSLQTNGLNGSTNGSNCQGVVRFRSMIDRGVRFVEKRFSLNDFLVATSYIIDKMPSLSPLNSINFPLPPNSFILPAQSPGNVANPNTQFGNYTEVVNFCIEKFPPPNNISHACTASNVTASPAPSSSTGTGIFSQLNMTILQETTSRSRAANKSKLESQITSKINHVISLFNSRVRIELIAIDTPDNVIQCLASNLHLESDETSFNSNWTQCLEKLNNIKLKKQLISFRLDEVLKGLRYGRDGPRSKVFILYSLKTDQFRLLVLP